MSAVPPQRNYEIILAHSPSTAQRNWNRRNFDHIYTKTLAAASVQARSSLSVATTVNHYGSGRDTAFPENRKHETSVRLLLDGGVGGNERRTNFILI